jgi:hypothetical protein
MTDKEFWQRVYIASLMGNPEASLNWHASVATDALRELKRRIALKEIKDED